MDNPTKYSFGNITGTTIQKASSHYVALKQNIRNLYGQVNGVLQQPITECVLAAPFYETKEPAGWTTGNTGTLFGGDTYVGRYTEKNTFFFFYDWLFNQPDGTQFNYPQHNMLPSPIYWANFNNYQTQDLINGLGGAISSLIGSILSPGGSVTVNSAFPHGHHALDGEYGFLAGSSTTDIRLAVKDAWFYLFSSGVRDFFCESEINIALRDWGNNETERHYDPYDGYEDTKDMFKTSIIKAGNYYKYDQSLSVSKLFMNYISWAAVQPHAYNPFLAETCYVYKPKRVIYSLPAQLEGTRDNWYIFLANNYKDFLSRITCIKSISKSGALIFSENESPKQFLGVDQLQTASGTKLTIGDGGLFSQPLQNTINVDSPYEYGSCQDGLSVINTPAGVFWISQNQGKIFQMMGSPIEITAADLKWWFAQYLPYRLIAAFPNFQLTENPVIGIGCQSIYDNENGLVYFTKKDYRVRPELEGVIDVTYDHIDPISGRIISGSGNTFWATPTGGGASLAIVLGNPIYFEDCSWTISYDPKVKGWLSYHDWHPSLCMPGKNTFMTVKDNGIWIHNQDYNNYCNYYNQYYPFEVEYQVNTIQTVNTVRSLEYLMEVYKYAPNAYDRFHVLDYNFNEAVIYNTEQVSGLLKLNLRPKNNPAAILTYPDVQPGYIDILYSKEEQKFRLNQFLDVTRDRGEYNLISQQMIWNTAENGYVRTLNTNNLEYTKDPFQRKKFRHYTNTVFLRRTSSSENPMLYKMMVLLTNNKNLYSAR